MKTASILFCALLLTLASGGPARLGAAPVNYDEAVNGDLDQANPPTFTLDVGDNAWMGSLGPTPTTNTQDAFFAILPSGTQVTHIHWEYGSNRGDQSFFDVSGPPESAPPFGTVVSHQVKSAGDDLTDSGFSIVNPVLPVTIAGMYKVEVTTNFAVATSSWKVVLTVEAIPSGGQPATWGKVKGLYK